VSDVYPVMLEGPEVTLREIDMSDVPAVGKWVGDPEAVRYVPLGPLEPAATVRYVEQLVTEAHREPREGYTLAIVDRAAREVIGSAALSIDSRTHRRAELGYILRRDAWGRGLATAAAARMLRFAFDELGINRVWAVCDPDNPASIRVLQKVGMAEEGRLRQDLLVHGVWRDSLLFATVASDARDDPARFA
jgi:RimJ/RimL family protein N-acetyltransferase